MKKALIIFIAVFAVALCLIGCTEPQQYNISFVADGRTVFSMVSLEGSTVTMPQSPVKEGYEFVGWAVGGVPVSFPYTPTGDTTFTAVWGCGHNWEKQSTTVTCERAGFTFYICSECGKVKKEETLAIGHSFEQTESVKATCLNDGYDLYECANCGASEKRNEAR